MTVKDLKKLLENHPDNLEVIVKDYKRGDDLWPILT